MDVFTTIFYRNYIFLKITPARVALRKYALSVFENIKAGMIQILPIKVRKNFGMAQYTFVNFCVFGSLK